MNKWDAMAIRSSITQWGFIIMSVLTKDTPWLAWMCLAAGAASIVTCAYEMHQSRKDTDDPANRAH